MSVIWNNLFKKHVRSECEANAKSICNSDCELCASDIEKWKAWFDMWGIKYHEEGGTEWAPEITTLVFDANYSDAAEVVFENGKFIGIDSLY